MKLRRLGVVVAAVIVAAAVGGTLAYGLRSRFTLISWAIVDDGGWPSLNIRFEAVGDVNLILFDPNGEVVDKLHVTGGMTEAVLRMADFHETPAAGTYRLVAKNPLGMNVFEENMKFGGVDIKVVYCWINVTWDGEYGSVTGMNITLRNVGDILTYPCGMGITVGGESDEGYVYPIEGLLPGEEKSYRVAYGILWLQPGTYQVTVRIYDAAGYLITIYETTITIPP